MVDKIFEKYGLLKDVLRAFNEAGKRKEDEATLIEAVKVIIKDLVVILNEEKSKD